MFCMLTTTTTNMIGQQQQSIKRKKSRNKHCKIFKTMLKKFINLEDDDNDRILQTFLHASRESGYRIIDLNQGISNGSSLLQSTIKQGRRQSISTAFLEPILKQRINLHVLANSMVTKILFENDRAIGVRFQRDWQQYSVFARQEVIISAGTLQSPKLLMLSGIGPRTELNRQQIPLKIDLPGVGENLQDHIYPGGIHFQVDAKYSFVQRRVVTIPNLLSYFASGRGMLLFCLFRYLGFSLILALHKIHPFNRSFNCIRWC